MNMVQKVVSSAIIVLGLGVIVWGGKASPLPSQALTASAINPAFGGKENRAARVIPNIDMARALEGPQVLPGGPTSTWSEASLNGNYAGLITTQAVWLGQARPLASLWALLLGGRGAVG